MIVLATMKDVARYAEVSIATVSKYLNGGNVLDKNEEKIQEAIETLDYRVNEIARGLKTNQSMTVGILIPSLKEIFFTSIISYIENILEKRGYSIIVCDYGEDLALEEEKIEFMLKKMIDGLILVPLKDEVDQIKKVMKEDIPIVLIDRMISGIECDAVVTDSVNGSYKAVEELLKRDHTRVGIINGPENIYTSQQRLEGYKRAHQDYNIDIKNQLIKYGDYEVQGGYKKTKELLNRSDPPGAIFVTNYDMTIGTLMAVNEKGVKIPDELSLIGFDNIMQLSQIYKPSLSFVSQPMQEIGTTAAEILLKRLKGDRSHFPEISRLQTEVKIKGSVDYYKN
ncbi:MAG: LacI family DNA-binding transcriptional regulator [Halanaerobiaceae bacterium]